MAKIFCVANQKGGVGKTSTCAHLAMSAALDGYRVLAVDLDPQASLSALFGYQPEFDIKANETLYGAIRYDDQRRPLRDIIRKTNFPNLDLVPGNLELMEFEHETPRALAARGGNLFFTRIADALAEVEAGLWRQLDDLKTTPPSAEELARVRAQVIAGLVYERDSITSQATTIGQLETVGLSWQLMDGELAELSAVTPSDIQQAAQIYFTRERLSVAHILPEDTRHD